MLTCITGNIYFEAVGVWLLVPGVAGFLLMGIDKDKALHHEWRISEKTLLTVARLKL